ncbi:hypothetical protein ABTM39_20180, partial [Acinetobacter baumannii]
MMMSAHRGLHSLGAVLTIGVGACLFVSLVTLPALLTLISRQRGQGAVSDRQAPVRQDPTGINSVGRSQDQPAAEQPVIV